MIGGNVLKIYLKSTFHLKVRKNNSISYKLLRKIPLKMFLHSMDKSLNCYD